MGRGGRRARRRVSVQEGSSPPLAYTAEVGFFLFFFLFFFSFYRYIYIHARIHARREGGWQSKSVRGRGGKDRGGEEEVEEEEEEVGTDIRGHTEFLTSPGSL